MMIRSAQERPYHTSRARRDRCQCRTRVHSGLTLRHHRTDRLQVEEARGFWRPLAHGAPPADTADTCLGDRGRTSASHALAAA